MSKYSIFKGLAAAYVNKTQDTDAFYTYRFDSNEDLLKRAADVKASTCQASSSAVAEALYDFNQQLGMGEKTEKHIEALRQGALSVVTGQQAGIFTGALYTVYKAITTIKLARKMTTLTGETVVPIFWIASEDHDFQEIQALKYYAAGKVQTLSIDKLPAKSIEKYLPSHLDYSQLRASVGHLKTGVQVKDAIETFLSASAEEELTHLESLLQTTFIEEDTLSGWFGKLMSKLFNDYGLVFVDPMLDALRQEESNLFVRALEQFETIQRGLIKQTQLVEGAGFKPSLEFDEAQLNLFYYIGGERLPIKLEEDQWVVRQGEVYHRFTTEAMVNEMKAAPDRFSTNVVLRPIAQDYLFRTIAYVAGPGEINYYAQLRLVYPAFDKTMPVIFPRENFTVVTEQMAEKMDELGVDAQEILMLGATAIKDKVLDLKDDIRIDALFEHYNQQVSEGYDHLIAQLEKISPDIHEFTEKNKGMILSQIAYLQEKAHRFHRRNHKELLKQFSDIEAQLIPEGGLQERTLSVLQYYGKKGDSFIQYLTDELPLDIQHRIIRI